MCLDRRFMSMQLLGDNLSTLRKSCTDTNFRLSWDSTRYLGLEMLRTLQQVHKVGYIHRDVKPSNFAMGRKDLSDSKVYIIDFGLARKVNFAAYSCLHEPVTTTPRSHLETFALETSPNYNPLCRYVLASLQYLEDNGWSHQPARENRRFRGSSAYASVHAHKEKDLSRRDDLWSLLYVLVEFQQGDLPWRHACLDSVRLRSFTKPTKKGSSQDGSVRL
jgi:tau tubulin kinase